MTPERWQRVKDLFDAALEQEPDARARFLSEATPDDPALASEVMGLLASDREAGTFLSAPPLSPSLGESLATTGPSLVGRHIGPYRVLGEIGHGGMGTVYRAVRDDDQYQKQVAIKLVRGGMDAEFVLQRFKAECQIPANLEHPNIARLVDGGTTEEGWPYFSMEYVEGQPIDRYCAGLGVRERLDLFRIVCAAVQYAHQVKVGDFQERLGRTEAALATFREHLVLAEDQAARTAGTADPRSDYDQRAVRVGQYRLADLASRSGLHAEAERHARAAYASAQRAVATDPANAMSRRDLAGTAMLVGDTLLRAGRAREAVPLFVEAERELATLVQRDPQNATARADRLSAVTRLADARAAMGDVRAGLEAYVEVQPRFEERLRDDPENLDARANLGSVLASMGDLRQKLGDTSGALALLPRALALFPLPAAEGSAQARYERAAVLGKLAYTEAVAAQETRRPKADRARLAQSSCERYGESLLLWRGLSGPTPSSHFDVGPPAAQRVAAERALERCPHLP